MAWYQRTYFNLNISSLINFFNFRILFLFVIFYFLNFYFLNLNHVQCFSIKYQSNFLNNCIINGKPIYFYKNINPTIIYNLWENINYNKFDNLTYKICKFNDIYKTKLPYNHPFNHPHLNILEFNNLNSDIFVSVQMSTKNFNNCSILTSNNLMLEDRFQFIANNFYFYEKNKVTANFNEYVNSIDYIKNNNKVIDDHIKLIIKNYKKINF